MALGRRPRSRQDDLFVATSEIRSSGNPFYEALHRLLEGNGFDDFAEELCGEFYAESQGRPSVSPGVYFRMLMVGYLEGTDSDGGIAWRCADSISLRGSPTRMDMAKLDRKRPGKGQTTSGCIQATRRRGSRR